MSALPSNLARVGEDLARATQRDAERSLKRRRAATLSFVVAVLVVTATTALAGGWLFDETPTLRAVPVLGAGAARGALAPGDPFAAAGALAGAEALHRSATSGVDNTAPLGTPVRGESRVLLTHLGPEGRTLSSVSTSTGGVCLALTGLQVQCVPTFASDQQITWLVTPSGAGTTLVWGVARDAVTAIEAVSGDGHVTAARLGNGAFYAELSDAKPARLVVHLRDGTSDTVPLFPCPLTSPNCTK
ncbi:MAG TPA: hypothetical protein VFD90_10610 [Gaiellales bacterium]|jgi:hypothetical protein|nr:hypothetical protein [Gaiellales bacterium]